MADGEAPEKVRKANNVRWKEYAKMAKVERKLVKRLREDPGQRPFIPEPSLPINLAERTVLERCGECDHCKATGCETCSKCQGEGPRAKRAQSQGIGTNVQGPCEGEQRRCVNWPENPLPPPSSNFSWETSSAVNKATTENLASGLEELEAQQAKMTDATTKLLSVVSEAGGGPWSDGPGLKEDLLSEWLEVQEDRADRLQLYKICPNTQI